jgi:hypothetical protein
VSRPTELSLSSLTLHRASLPFPFSLHHLTFLDFGHDPPLHELHVLVLYPRSYEFSTTWRWLFFSFLLFFYLLALFFISNFHALAPPHLVPPSLHTSMCPYPRTRASSVPSYLTNLVIRVRNTFHGSRKKIAHINMANHRGSGITETRDNGCLRLRVGIAKTGNPTQ